MTTTLDRISLPSSTPEAKLTGLPHASKAWAHHPPRRGETTPEIALESRRWRVGMRLLWPDVWQDHLRRLPHYDPAYAYDELYEYEEDWTTDPNYGGRVDTALEYNKDGFAVSAGSRHQDIITFLKWVLSTFLGARVVREPELYIPVAISETLELYTESGRLKDMYKPDLLVLPNALEPGRERTRREHEVRMDKGHPAPLLAIEVLSDTSMIRDSGEKHAVYEALGIREYLLVDPGEAPDPDDPETEDREPALSLFRLSPDGTAYRSADHENPLHICGVGVRLVETDAGQAPFPIVLQWWDPDAGVWREPVGDTWRGGRAEGLAAGEKNVLLRVLNSHLPNLTAADRAEVAKAWEQGVDIDDALERIQKAGATPAEWRAVLGVPQSRFTERGPRGSSL